jgi:hypothetical protein
MPKLTWFMLRGVDGADVCCSIHFGGTHLEYDGATLESNLPMGFQWLSSRVETNNLPERRVGDRLYLDHDASIGRQVMVCTPVARPGTFIPPTPMGLQLLFPRCNTGAKRCRSCRVQCAYAGHPDSGCLSAGRMPRARQTSLGHVTSIPLGRRTGREGRCRIGKSHHPSIR